MLTKTPARANVGRIISDRPIVEGGERRLDLAEAFVHFVRQLVGAVFSSSSLNVFGLQRVDRRLLLAGEIVATPPVREAWVWP